MHSHSVCFQLTFLAMGSHGMGSGVLLILKSQISKFPDSPKQRSEVIGSFSGMIKVTTIQGKTYEGEFYALDPVTKSVTLKGPGDGYLVINSHHITSLTGSFGKPADVSKFGAR